MASKYGPHLREVEQLHFIWLPISAYFNRLWRMRIHTKFGISDDARKRFCVLALLIYAIISYFFRCVSSRSTLCGIAQALDGRKLAFLLIPVSSAGTSSSPFFLVHFARNESLLTYGVHALVSIIYEVSTLAITTCSGKWNFFVVCAGASSRTFHWTDTSGGTDDMCLRIWHGKLRYFI